LRLKAYATSFSAPVMANTDVLSVHHAQDTFMISTSRGNWRARAVLVATGHCDVPLIPNVARSLPSRVLSLHSSQYRSPRAIPEGAVLVVGASSSGVQIADELQRSGRKVTLAVGRHTRAPRTWRGRDIFWWMDRTGILAERTRNLPDAAAARRQPTLQLAGRPDRANVDLAMLQATGVRLAGRVAAIAGDRIAFDDDLGRRVRASQAKLERLLARIDAFAGVGPDSPPDEIQPVDLSLAAPVDLSLDAKNVHTVIWATGYRRGLTWLRIPGAIASDGEIVHQDGVAAVPGLYALGFRLLRKRDSHFIGGVGSDAAALAEHISAYLNQSANRAA
jgi:putative flavoprotein involved in K+ transport